MTARLQRYPLFREAMALARQGALLSHGGTALRETAWAPHLTVFIHGYWSWGGVFAPLADHLAIQSVAPRQLHFTYKPMGSIESHARRLDQMIRELRHDGPVHIVGHSLGGLVARYYAQVLERRTDRLVCLATPHHGTTRARMWSSLPLAGEIAPGSATLNLLHATRNKLDGARVCSIVAADDSLVAPLESSALEGHEVVRLADVGHQSVLFDAGSWQHVARVLSHVPALPARAA